MDVDGATTYVVTTEPSTTSGGAMPAAETSNPTATDAPTLPYVDDASVSAAITAAAAALPSPSSVFVISSSPHGQHVQHLSEQPALGLHPSEVLSLGQLPASQGLQTLLTGTHLSLPPMTSGGQFDLPSSIFAVNPQSSHGYPVLWLTNSAMDQKVSDDIMRVPLPPVSEVRSSRLPKLQPRHKEIDASLMTGNGSGGDSVGIHMSDSQRVAMNAYIAAQIKQHQQHQQDTNPLPPVSELSVAAAPQQMALPTDQLDNANNLHLVALSSCTPLFTGSAAAANIYSMAPSQMLVSTTDGGVGPLLSSHHHHQHTPLPPTHHHHQSASLHSHVTSSSHVLLASTDPHFTTSGHHHHHHQMSLTAADLMDSMTVGIPHRLQVGTGDGFTHSYQHHDDGTQHDHHQQHHHHHHLLDKPDSHSLPSLQMLPQGTLVVPAQEPEPPPPPRHHPQDDGDGPDSDELAGLVETLACYRCKACPYISLSKEGVEQHVRATHMSKPAPHDTAGKRERPTPPPPAPDSMPEPMPEPPPTVRRSGVIREPEPHRQHHHHHHHREPDQHQHHDPTLSGLLDHHQHHRHQPVQQHEEQLQPPPPEDPPPPPPPLPPAMLSSNKDDTFICGMCEEGFADIESCSVHMAVEHNVPVDHVQLEPIEQSGPQASIQRDHHQPQHPQQQHHHHHHHHQEHHHQPQSQLVELTPPHLYEVANTVVQPLVPAPLPPSMVIATGVSRHLTSATAAVTVTAVPSTNQKATEVRDVTTPVAVRRPPRRRQPRKTTEASVRKSAPPVTARSTPTEPPVSPPLPPPPSQDRLKAENGECLTSTKVEEEESSGATYVMDIVGASDDDSDATSPSNDVDEDYEDDVALADGDAEDKSDPSKRRGRPKGSKAPGVGAPRRNMRRSADAVLGHRCSLNNCGIRMQSHDNMEYHRRCHAADSDKYECPECREECGSWKTMSIHLWRVHVVDMELYACDLCSYKTYSYGKLMNMHRRIHSEERPFLCDICGKGFKTNKQLRNHKVIHLDKRRYRSYRSGECDVCQRHFSDKRMLRVHKDTVHNKLRPFLCNFCGYSASCRSTLKMHVRQHTGEKPFTCTMCDYRTADHNSLRRHKMRHSGEKPYKCPFCPYACIQSSTYKTHLRNKHPGLDEGLMFCCERCSFRTIKRENFVTHVADHRQEDEAASGGSAAAAVDVISVELLRENADTPPVGGGTDQQLHHHHHHQQQQQEHHLQEQQASGELIRSPLPDDDGSLQEMPLHPGHFIYSVPEEMREHVGQHHQHLYKLEVSSPEERFPILAGQLKLGHQTVAAQVVDSGAALRALPEADHREVASDEGARQH